MLQNEDEELKSEIIQLFGENAYLNNELNRPYIAACVFSDSNLLQQLNKLVHPKVRAAFEEFCQKHNNSTFIFNEAAILFETGSHKQFDANVLVISNNETRIQRVMKRDNVSREIVLKRMQNQWNQEKLMDLSNFLIKNDENKLLIPQIIDLLEKLKNHFISS
jgi:dephospho-CoA kinase